MGKIIKLDYDDKEARLAIKKAPGEMVDAIHQILLKCAIYTQGAFRKNINAGATGALRRSVRYTFLNKVAVQIEPTLEYADYLEKGTRPHYPPIEPLRHWANQKGINPYALQHSIGKKGTAPHPYLDKTYRVAESYAHKTFDADMQKAIDKIL